MKISIQKISGWALKKSPIHVLKEKYGAEEHIKQELYSLDVDIENVYVDNEVIEIKFPFLDKIGEKYVLNCKDIGVVCQYLGSYSYDIIGDYGITLRFNHKNCEITNEIELVNIKKEE